VLNSPTILSYACLLDTKLLSKWKL